MSFKKARACKNVDIPPKDIINVKRQQVTAPLKGTVDNIKQPLVISPIPQIMLAKIFLSMPSFAMTEINIENNLLVVITSRSTKVKQITPPISIMELTDDTTLAEKSKFALLTNFEGTTKSSFLAP